MQKIQKIRIKNPDGSMSSEIPLSIIASGVTLSNGTSLQQAIGNFNTTTQGGDINTVINTLKSNIEQIVKEKLGKSGSFVPVVVSNTSQITDTSKIYIYTGTRSGIYRPGEWYYWDGSWKSGGVFFTYTDKQLTSENIAADGAAVGNKITEINNTIINEKNTLNTRISNEVQTLQDRIDTVEESLQDNIDNITINPNDLGLSQSAEDLTLYPTYRGSRSTHGIEIISKSDPELNKRNMPAEAKATGDAISELQDDISSATSTLNSRISSEVSTLDQKINDNMDTTNANIDDAKAELNSTINTEISELRTELQSDISDATDTINESIASIEESLEDIEIQPNNLGLTQDSDGTVYPTFKGTASQHGTQISPITDKTLTIVNQAADAGAVGDALDELSSELENISIDVDDLGLQQDPDTKYVYPTYRGERSENGIPLSGGGGGGGGSDTNNAVLTATNISGWLTKAIASGSDCPVQIRWSSIEEDEPTGSGSARITVNNTIRGVIQIQQGDIELNLKPYLSTGQNTVKIRISDVYDNGRTLTFNINYINFKIESSFVFDTPFSQPFSFTFTPYGSGAKTIHFRVDGQELTPMQTTASGQQLSYLIPAQGHGGHSLECYFTATVNEEQITSNVLYNEFMFLENDNTTPIITSTFNETNFDQYSSIVIPYRVYDPTANTAEVSIYVNGILDTTRIVDQTRQEFIYRADRAGSIAISFEVGQTTKAILLNITPVNIDVEAVEQDLVLYLSSKGRSNAEKADIRSSWIYNDVSAQFTNFNWILDGWQKDNQNIPVLRVMGDGRVYIPFNIFETDCKSTGKTIEIEFSTSYVVNYNAPVIECINHATTGTTDPVGFSITSQQITVAGAQTTRETLYKDNEHIRLSIVIEKQNKNRLLYIYVNGIMSRTVQYATGQRFAQLIPTGISIGSNDCAVDIYCIRVYNNDLTRRQVLNNWIADTQDGSDLVNRYNRNNVYEDDNITVNSLPSNLPYMIIEGTKLSQYKGDKVIVSGSYVDPVNPAKSFTFTGCQNNVQGTSSQGYYRKNYDMQFNDGFETTAGHLDGYQLRTNSIAFNRFVLKADVASSESANNTRLTMFYNDTCIYKTPEMEEDSRVRWGIEGVPIALFWFNPDDNTTTFLGKYNFNLPKRAPAPYGYPSAANDESWEFQWNNTANVKFQDADFTTMKGETPAWYDDWEARFPKDTFRDITQLQELVAWVNSTYLDAATNETFSSPKVYRIPSVSIFNREECQNDNSYTITEIKNSQQVIIGYDISCTKDTPAYRLAKFRAEFSDYFEVSSATYYYIFTEFFLMIDSWAKNMFIGFHGSPVTKAGRQMRRKAVIEPYDMDTAIGINNSGELMFDYHYETTDTVSSLISGGEGSAEGKETPVMNAQDSVLWSNFRDTFQTEITNMYSTLRSTTWSYQKVADMFTEYQSKWPEAIFNEDAYMKYLYPVDHAVVRNPNQPDETKPDAYMTTTEYLKMLQGSKEQQRRWWLFNRFRYIDSKYNVGDAQTTRLTLRIFNKNTINLSTAIDMYVGVMFGAGSTPLLTRTDANTAQSFNYDGGTSVQEFETHILSGDMIVDVGDLSRFYPNEIRFSNASRLRRLKIGDASSSYSNSNLTELDVTNSSLLEYIDCRNCINLETPVDLSNSPRLKEAYFSGTKLKGVEFADGGLLEKLYLPRTITSLTLLNLSKLNDISIPSYSNLTSLYLVNIDVNKINPVTILSAMPNNSNVHIEGFNINVSSDNEIMNIYNLLERMKGQTRERGWSEAQQRYSWNYTYYDHPIITGTITVLPATGQTKSYISGSLKALVNEHYPYLEIKADETRSTVYYYNWDGSELLYQEEVVANENDPEPNATYTGQPARPATPQYTYTFIGWSLEPNGRVNNNAKRNIQSDRNLYAAYSFVGKTYTVRFRNDNSNILLTVNNVIYGADVEYTGATPVSKNGPATEWEFKGWSPPPTNIQADTDCYAQYEDIRSIVSQYLAGQELNIDLSEASNIGQYAFYAYGSPHINITSNQIIADNIEENAFGNYYYYANGPYVYFTGNDPIIIESKNNIQTKAFGNGLSYYQGYVQFNSNKTLPLTINVNNIIKSYAFNNYWNYNHSVFYESIIVTAKTLSQYSFYYWYIRTPYLKFIIQDSIPQYAIDYIYNNVNIASSQYNIIELENQINNLEIASQGIYCPDCYSSSGLYGNKIILTAPNEIILNSNSIYCNRNDEIIYLNAANITVNNQGINQCKYLILNSPSIANWNALKPSRLKTIDGGIFVPSNLLQNYKNSSQYGYQYRIFSIDQYQQLESNKSNTKISIIFNGRTEQGSDYINIYYYYDNLLYRVGPYSGIMNNVECIIPTDNFYLQWHTDNSVISQGWNCTISETDKTISTSTQVSSLPKNYIDEQYNNRLPDSSPYQNNLNKLYHCFGYLNTSTSTFSLDYEDISDSWDQIVTNINNGSYKTRYHIGQIKKFTKDDQTYYAKLIAMDADTIYNSSEKAATTWLSQPIGSASMNDSAITTNGWKNSKLRTTLREQILPSLNSAIVNNIKTVDKTYYDADIGATLHTDDTISIPSMKELFNSNETVGNYYNSDNNYCFVRCVHSNAWTRTAVNNNGFAVFANATSNGNNSANVNCNYCIEFCL